MLNHVPPEKEHQLYASKHCTISLLQFGALLLIIIIIITVHLYSTFRIFVGFSNVALQFFIFLLRPLFSYHVIPLFLRGSQPLTDQLPGEHTGLPSYMRQCLIFVQPFNAALIHTLTHGGWACSNDPHMFFYVHQSHRHESTHPSLFISLGVLWEPLVCSYDISYSRIQQVSIKS